MTIVEAICAVLRTNTKGMTSQEVYKEIVKSNLYVLEPKNLNKLLMVRLEDVAII